MWSLLLLIGTMLLATGADCRRTSETGAFRGSSVLDEVPLIDGHNDFPINLYDVEFNMLGNFTFNSDLRRNPKWTRLPASHTDLPRLLAGKVGGQFWVAYVECNANQKDAVELTLDQIDVIKRLVARNPDHMRLVTSADGILDAFAQRKLASLICVEGGHSIDSRMAVLRLYYELGVRYLTLTHTCNTPWADQSGTDKSTSGKNVRKIGGLSEWGKRVVLEMNRLGMLVDLAHVSKTVMLDALRTSRAPVIFSHSSAYAVHAHERNVQDDVLQLVKSNRGIVMVNFYTGFLTAEPVSSIDDVIAHLEHIREQIGADHIGIGADFDGVRRLPVGLEDVSKYPALFDALAERGWNAGDLRKLAGENLIRVLREAESVRDSLLDELPYDEPIPNADLQATGDTFECRTDYNRVRV